MEQPMHILVRFSEYSRSFHEARYSTLHDKCEFIHSFSRALPKLPTGHFLKDLIDLT